MKTLRSTSFLSQLLVFSVFLSLIILPSLAHALTCGGVKCTNAEPGESCFEYDNGRVTCPTHEADDSRSDRRRDRATPVAPVAPVVGNICNGQVCRGYCERLRDYERNRNFERCVPMRMDRDVVSDGDRGRRAPASARAIGGTRPDTSQCSSRLSYSAYKECLKGMRTREALSRTTTSQ